MYTDSKYRLGESGKCENTGVCGGEGGGKGGEGEGTKQRRGGTEYLCRSYTH